MNFSAYGQEGSLYAVQQLELQMQHVADCQKYLPEASILRLEYGKSLSLITCSNVSALLRRMYSR